MRFIQYLRKPALFFLAAFLLYAVAICTHGYFRDWDPEEKITIKPFQNAKETIITDSLLTFITWNVGYCGLGKDADFCYDDEGMLYASRSMVTAPKEQVETYFAGANAFIQNAQSDFFLLQEVDMQADRSCQIREFDEFAKAKEGYAATYAENYHCDRVPIPILQPWLAYGRVRSGLSTMSRYQPTEATRYQLPGKYGMPDRMFQLDRCVALQRYKTNRGKDLVVINLHNSAYDPGDKIKREQLPYLHDLAVREYEKGNYVILGGDWNQCPPNFKFDKFFPGVTGYETTSLPDLMFSEDWTYGYDPTTSTNRKTKDPYKKGETFETLIDFFLVSPNVQVKLVKGIQQNFTNSDHQPVYMEVVLR